MFDGRLIGIQPADTIRASGHTVPHQQAGQMTAPCQIKPSSQKPSCNAGAIYR